MLTLAAILARTTRQPNGCRLWRGAVSSRGFGTVTVGAKLYVHRVVCERTHGRPPSPRHEACHSDTCAAHGLRGRLCVEPTHLRWGTRSENARDRERVKRGQHAGA